MTAGDGRFERQVRFAPLGEAGQARLAASRVLIVGCGATGGFTAQALHRAGVGTLVLVDRDVVDLTNLPRQVLFDEAHLGLPKVEAAAATLRRAGGPTVLELHATHLDADNVGTLAQGCDLVLDGTDNLPTRYLLNDLALERRLPWVYAGVVGGGGLALAVLPGRGPCLRCVFPEPPPPGTLPTCDTAGVIGPAVGAVASLQAGLALRLLVDPAGVEPALVEVDAWSGAVRSVRAPRDPQCPACGGGERRWLFTPASREAVVLCGRNTVQVRGAAGARVDLAALEARLSDAARDVVRAGPILRFAVEDVRLTLFPDGRALVEGTEDLARAQALVDRWVGR